MKKIDAAMRRDIKARSRAAAAHHYRTSLALLALWWASLVSATMLIGMGSVVGLSVTVPTRRDPAFLTLFPALLALTVMLALGGVFGMPFARLTQALWRQEPLSVLRTFAALRGRGLWNSFKLIGALTARALLWALAEPEPTTAADTALPDPPRRPSPRMRWRAGKTSSIEPRPHSASGPSKDRPLASR